MRSSNLLLTAVVAAIIAAAFACSDDRTPTAPTSNSTGASTAPAPPAGGGTSSTGTLSIRLTDSPFSDAKALLVTFSDVSVHMADPGDWKTVPFAAGTSRTCDLKKLQGATDVLGIGALAAGKYTQIRLNVTNAAIYFDNASSGGPCAPTIAAPAGRSAPVEIPSGEVKLNNEFTLAGAGTTTITLDFDGDQSVRQTGSGNGNGNESGGSNGNTRYMMSPVIRIVSVQ